MRKGLLVLGIIVFLMLAGVAVIFSQETPAETLLEPETQWLWGEVISVDSPKNEILVKYLDYETEQEKEIAVTINEQTTYENVNAISQISPQDTVSIDYVVSIEGKNIAKNISVEKPEAQPIPQPEAAETAVEEAAPAIPETAE